MLTDDGKHLYVSWDEYHMLTERLALKVHNSGWQFDQILCLARGGMRPGDVLSRVFDKPLAIMSTSSYRAEAGTIQGRLDMAKYITMPKGDLAGRVRGAKEMAGHVQELVRSLEVDRGVEAFVIAQHYGRACQLSYYLKPRIAPAVPRVGDTAGLAVSRVTAKPSVQQG